MITKTILFASLIAVMAVGVTTSPAYAAYEDIQNNIFDRIEILEGKIDTATNDVVKEGFEVLYQESLAKALEISYDQFGAENSLNNYETPIDAYPPNGTYPEFNLSGTILGCDGESQSWSYDGFIPNGFEFVGVHPDFPSTITTAESCDEIELQDAIQLHVQPIFSDGGCMSATGAKSTILYVVECGTEFSGLMVVKITFDYGNNTETHYTYLYV